MMTANPVPAVLDADVVRGWPLPQPDAEGDKEERGRVLIVAGSAQLAGAALLAGTAALRAGAGKLKIATPRSAAPLLGLAVPEALVMGLPETPGGGLDASGVSAVAGMKVDCVLMGPGLQEAAAALPFVQALLRQLPGASVVLDALAMQVVGRQQRFEEPVLLTPHAGEMAKLTNESKASVLADPPGAALSAARAWNAVVALKGATTWIATPGGKLWRHDGGDVGLATSGSGDALAGVIAGLAARGASLEQAACWGVVLHATAGKALSDRMGPLGYLARELPAEVPRLMKALEG